MFFKYKGFFTRMIYSKEDNIFIEMITIQVSNTMEYTFPKRYVEDCLLTTMPITNLNVNLFLLSGYMMSSQNFTHVNPNHFIHGYLGKVDQDILQVLQQWLNGLERNKKK